MFFFNSLGCWETERFLPESIPEFICSRHHLIGGFGANTFQLCQPACRDAEKVGNSPKPLLNGAQSDAVGQLLQQLERHPLQFCIDMIFTGEDTHERSSFTEKELDEFIDSMESKQFQKIGEFFETMPKLRHTVDFNCTSCSKGNLLVLEGLESFFG